MYDVIVIGSGVTGCTAAYFLASRGKRVLMLEKEKIPRYKTCGGGVIAKVNDLLPYDIEPVVEKKINCVDIIDHNIGKQFRISREYPVINMTMRSKLDMFMMRKAEDKNVASLKEETVSDIKFFDEHAEVITAKDIYKGKFIIGSDGAMGISTKVLGLKNSFKKIPAIECELLVDKTSHDKFGNLARFDFGFIPKGYGWVFPKEDHLSIGVLSFNNSNVNLNEYLKEYLSKIGIDKSIKKEIHGYIIPLRNKKRKSGFGRILLAGDAAGIADPLTAEGISYAILSGRYAANAILDGGENIKKVNSIYEQQIKNIWLELKYAGLLSRFFYSSSRLRNHIFEKFGYSLSNLMTDVILGKAQYRKLLKNPVNYLKLIGLIK